MNIVNVEIAKTYKADVEFSQSDRLGIFYYSCDYAKSFNQVFMDSLKESLKTLKSKRDHKEYATSKALEAMVLAGHIPADFERNKVLSDIGFFDSEGTYVIHVLFQKLDELDQW